MQMKSPLHFARVDSRWHHYTVLLQKKQIRCSCPWRNGQITSRVWDQTHFLENVGHFCSFSVRDINKTIPLCTVCQWATHDGQQPVECCLFLRGELPQFSLRIVFHGNNTAARLCSCDFLFLRYELTRVFLKVCVRGKPWAHYCRPHRQKHCLFNSTNIVEIWSSAEASLKC